MAIYVEKTLENYQNFFLIFVMPDDTDFRDADHECDNCGVTGDYIAHSVDGVGEFVECNSCGHLYMWEGDVPELALNFPEHWRLIKPDAPDQEAP